MIARKLSETLLSLLSDGKTVIVSGPKAGGKSSLLANILPDFTILSFEIPDTRLDYQANPEFFLRNLPSKIILDDIHRMPELLIQFIQHNDLLHGKQVVAASDQNFNFLDIAEQIDFKSEKLAFLTLLPLSLNELSESGTPLGNYEQAIFKGALPQLYASKVRRNFFDRYINEYANHELQKIKSLNKQDLFFRFIKLCAGRVGEPLNMSALANDCGVSVNTIKTWLDLLEASFIIFRLPPHTTDFNKRLVKMPKLYFYDTGLLCGLLNIRSEKEISTHYLVGKLFENFIINEFYKYRLNQGEQTDYYFWRDSKGKEIDLIVENGKNLIPVEFKAGFSVNKEYFKELKYWNKISGNTRENAIVIYGGDETKKMEHGLLLSWKNLMEFISIIA